MIIYHIESNLFK